MATSANNYTLMATGSSVLPTDGKEDSGWPAICRSRSNGGIRHEEAMDSTRA